MTTQKILSVQGAQHTALRISSKDGCGGGSGQVEHEAYGIIASRPASPQMFGAWQIGANTYQAISITQFKEQHGALIVGAFVEVKYVMQNGGRIAREIESEDAPPGGNASLVGKLSINGNTWSVDGTVFVVNDSTFFDDRITIVQNGVWAHLNAKTAVGIHAQAADATLVATKIIGLANVSRVNLR